jgi:rubrerythrin
MVELATNEEKLFSDWPFRGIQLTQDPGVIELYKLALETEQRARQHFRQLASEFPAGLENELCREVLAEEDEYVAMLETELAQIT